MLARSRGEIGVSADDQPLAGEVGRGDRRHVALVEQRHLKMSAADQRLERGRAQGGDPVEPGRAQIFADARLGDHAAVADEHDMVDGEAALQLRRLVGERHGIGSVSRERLDGDGAAVRRAQEAVDDLPPGLFDPGVALLAVAVVAAFGEPTATAFDIARRDVVEHQRPALEMAFRQRGLDRALTLDEPVEGGIEFVLTNLAQGQLDAEARCGGGGIERPGCGELGGRGDDAADDHRHDEIARAIGLRGLRPEQTVQTDRARGPQNRGHDRPMAQVQQRSLPYPPPSRSLSRSRMAGGEPRLGTVSMCMDG